MDFIAFPLHVFAFPVDFQTFNMLLHVHTALLGVCFQHCPAIKSNYCCLPRLVLCFGSPTAVSPGGFRLTQEPNSRTPEPEQQKDGSTQQPPRLCNFVHIVPLSRRRGVCAAIRFFFGGWELEKLSFGVLIYGG